ncbi:MAG: SRPBCC domain-containing protein [Streptosporangiaceae bacterium]|nr:SRPBCC domain-containing protein [Streptosporangiaceae bacterium]MBV9853269.1 SRPBCC domain-containing protein [Streptosporangiaceae bacterium]
MTPNAIEREILIEAPAETVWSVVTEPGQISRWFSDVAEIDLVPGGEGTLTFADRATNQRATVRLLVESVEPPHRFSFRWDHPAGVKPDESNSLRVEFTLAAEGRSTRLRVTESGFDALNRPQDEKTAYFDAHSKGWDTHLGSLRDYVAGRS